MSSAIIGWDVGGAHLKAARINDLGAVTAVTQVPCQLWRGLGELREAIDAALAVVGQCNRHAVTMTGEMVDLFPDRKSGVIEIAAFLSEVFRDQEILFYCGDKKFVDIDGVAAQTLAIASANWRASVEFVASQVAHCVFVDIGSTTTDIVAIENSRPRFQGHDDYSRLICGELVYSGVVRTPLMALCSGIEFRGATVPIIAEHFATTADIYRVLDELPENVDLQPSADGKEKTAFASARRIARIVGRDIESAAFDVWRELAQSFRAQQVAKIAAAINALVAKGGALVGAGIGDFIVREIAEKNGRDYIAFSEIIPIDGASQGQATHVAPAIAVALLAQQI